MIERNQEKNRSRSDQKREEEFPFAKSYYYQF